MLHSSTARTTQSQPPVHDIHTIMRGGGRSKTSNRSCKRYVWVAKQRVGHAEIFIINYCPQSVALAAQTITFIQKEVAKVFQPYNDALVLTLQIANHNVHMVLINSGSSVDVLFRTIYSQMRLLLEVLKPTSTSLYGFFCYSIQPFEGVELPVIGNYPT